MANKIAQLTPVRTPVTPHQQARLRQMRKRLVTEQGFLEQMQTEEPRGELAMAIVSCAGVLDSIDRLVPPRRTEGCDA
ncbi:MAG: hypothetical protein F6J95_023890 [Leptolyngbya sp. SIO1E4]|nr:hypothetical protein [Leptolyngbya sp. SIO1E4]